MADVDDQKRNRFSRWLSSWIGQRFSNSLFGGALLWIVVLVAAVLLFTRLDPYRLGLAIGSAFAAAAVGALGGFLFGIPKSRSDGRPATAADDGSFTPNTNLEQISDWLTKILLGVGLIQFRQIGVVIYDLGSAVGSGLTGTSATPSGTTFGIALLVGSTVVSFLLFYMWTTTRLYEVLTTGNEGKREASPSGPTVTPEPQ